MINDMSCKDCKWMVCTGWHCYECTNEESEKFERGISLDDTCNKAEEV